MFRLLNVLGGGRRSLLVLGLVVLVYSVGGGAFEFLLPILLDDFLGNFVAVGFMLALPSLVSLLADIPLGSLSDRVGRVKLMSFGLFIMAVVGLLFQYIYLPIHFMMLLLLWGLAYQIFKIPSLAYLMDISPKKESAKYFGVYMAFTSLGFAVGPAIAGFLLIEEESYILYLYSLFCILSLLIVLTSLKKTAKSLPVSQSIQEIIEKDRIVLKEIRDFKELRAVGVLILYLTFVFAFSELIIWVFEPLYFTSLKIDPVLGGLILSSFILPFVILYIPGGMLADRYGRRKPLTLGLASSGIFLILFGLSANPYHLIVLALLISSGFALTLPSIEGLLMDISTRHKKGEIVGVWNVSEDLGYIIGPIVGGLIAEYSCIGNIFVVTGLMLVLSIIPVLTVLRNK